MTTNPTRRRRIMREFLLKEISAVDRPAQQGALMAIMKRLEPDREAARMQMKKIDPMPRGYDSFESAIAAIAAAEGVPLYRVMSKAAAAWPALMDRYQSEGTERVAKAADAVDKARAMPAAVRHFHGLVDAVQARDGCSRSTAIMRARQENPAAHDAYQSA